MIVYVMRHAKAVAADENLGDEWRYLTGKGRAAAEKMGSLIAGIGPRPQLTITSPLTRAVQTAEIAARSACRRNEVVANELLLPGGDVSKLVAHLHTIKNADCIMLVGHEPQLGMVVATLLECREKRMTLKKCACVALEIDREKGGTPAAFLWYLVPGKKRITSLGKAFPQEVRVT